TLVLWSVLTLKETAVLTVALVGLWALQFLAQSTSARRSADVLVLLIVAMVISVDLRLTTTVILAPLALVVIARRLGGRADTWLFAAGTVVVVAALGIGFLALRA